MGKMKIRCPRCGSEHVYPKDQTLFPGKWFCFRCGYEDYVWMFRIEWGKKEVVEEKG